MHIQQLVSTYWHFTKRLQLLKAWKINLEAKFGFSDDFTLCVPQQNRTSTLYSKYFVCGYDTALGLCHISIIDEVQRTERETQVV